MKKISILLAFVLFGTMAQAKSANCEDTTQYPDVTTTQIKKMIAQKGVAIIDVNTESSYKDDHVPGAIHFASNEKKLTEVLPKDKNAKIVAYCGGKSCGAWKKAAIAACKMGYKNISHYSEGIKGWKKSKKTM